MLRFNIVQIQFILIFNGFVVLKSSLLLFCISPQENQPALTQTIREPPKKKRRQGFKEEPYYYFEEDEAVWPGEESSEKCVVRSLLLMTVFLPSFLSLPPSSILPSPSLRPF